MKTPGIAVSPDTATSGRHPLGLKVIFFTEMWERFSYYSMRALLALYLVKALDYSRANALELYGIYTGLVYMTPLVGGYLADRYLGVRQSAVIGALIRFSATLRWPFRPGRRPPFSGPIGSDRLLLAGFSSSKVASGVSLHHALASVRTRTPIPWLGNAS